MSIELDRPETRVVILEHACHALVALVRAEYSTDWTLSHIALLGLPEGATADQMQALEALETMGY